MKKPPSRSAPCPKCRGRWDETKDVCTKCLVTGAVVVGGKRVYRRWRKRRDNYLRASAGRRTFKHGRNNGPKRLRVEV